MHANDHNKFTITITTNAKWKSQERHVDNQAILVLSIIYIHLGLKNDERLCLQNLTPGARQCNSSIMYILWPFFRVQPNPLKRKSQTYSLYLLRFLPGTFYQLLKVLSLSLYWVCRSILIAHLKKTRRRRMCYITGMLSEVEFVHPVSPGGSVKFFPAV